MKTILINKCGYTVGVYGCSNEFFNAIAIDGERVIGFVFSGLYGAENRVEKAFKNLGYESKYIPLNVYGKLIAKETKRAYTEHTVINNINELIEHGYIEFNKEYRDKAGLPKLNK